MVVSVKLFNRPSERFTVFQATSFAGGSDSIQLGEKDSKAIGFLLQKRVFEKIVFSQIETVHAKGLLEYIQPEQ